MPKLDRCASPQAWTTSPVHGVLARSLAIGRAAPRKKANGDSSIRPYRTGTSSGTLDSACRSSNARGSGRFAGGSNTAWLSRGAAARAALPRVTRSAIVSRPRSGSSSPPATRAGAALARGLVTTAPKPSATGSAGPWPGPMTHGGAARALSEPGTRAGVFPHPSGVTLPGFGAQRRNMSRTAEAAKQATLARSTSKWFLRVLARRPLPPAPSPPARAGLTGPWRRADERVAARSSRT